MDVIRGNSLEPLTVVLPQQRDVVVAVLQQLTLAFFSSVELHAT